MKTSTLAAGLKAAALPKRAGARSTRASSTRSQTNKAEPTVMIGGQFPREVRRTLLLVQAEPENSGKTLKQLLGEAINDLCAKYGKPQPYSSENDGTAP